MPWSDLFKLWVGGHEIRDYTLCLGICHPIWWWGRVGSVLQLIGGALVVFELIGAARLEAFGNGLSAGVSVEHLKRIARASFSLLLAVVRIPMGRKGEPVVPPGVNWQVFWLVTAINAAIAFGLSSWLSNQVVGRFPTPLTWLLSPSVLLLCSFMLFGPTLLVLVIAITLGTGFLIDTLLVEPTAMAVRLTADQSYVKLLGLILLVVGVFLELSAQ